MIDILGASRKTSQMNSAVIETVNENNLTNLLPIIREYQAFYGVEHLTDETNQTFFSQFGEQSDKGCLFILRIDQKIVGFATIYYSYASTLASKIAIMNDLFTIPEHRGIGVAKKLIEHCRMVAKHQNCVRLQWLTAPSNRPAQVVYDSLETTSTTWRCYIYPT